MLLWAVVALLALQCSTTTAQDVEYPSCDHLRYGQFECDQPPLDNYTGTPANCPPSRTVQVQCRALEGVDCVGPREWNTSVPCVYTTGHKFSTALALSIFLGNFGIDRFYLGYPTIGLLKLLTFGGFFVGNWVDIILIATQTLLPADGSDYVIPAYGLPRLIHNRFNQNTAIQPQVVPFNQEL